MIGEKQHAQPTNISYVRALAARFGLEAQYNEEDVEILHQMVGRLQHDFGMTRMKLGALLLAVKHHDLWRGKAQSFGEYLESLKIRPTAARQYMIAAERLIFHLKLDDHQLEAAARASMTTLVSACNVITAHNAEEIVSVLESLSDRDAKQVIGNLEDHRKPLHEQREVDPQLKKLEREFFELPNDLRYEFLQKIGGARKQSRTSDCS